MFWFLVLYLTLCCSILRWLVDLSLCYTTPYHTIPYHTCHITLYHTMLRITPCYISHHHHTMSHHVNQLTKSYDVPYYTIPNARQCHIISHCIPYHTISKSSKSSSHYLSDTNRFDVSSKGPSSGISVNHSIPYHTVPYAVSYVS